MLTITTSNYRNGIIEIKGTQLELVELAESLQRGCSLGSDVSESAILVPPGIEVMVEVEASLERTAKDKSNKRGDNANH
jgi:translation initiation factor 1 (eIF-1/SUI1)